MLALPGLQKKGLHVEEGVETKSVLDVKNPKVEVLSEKCNMYSFDFPHLHRHDLGNQRRRRRRRRALQYRTIIDGSCLGERNERIALLRGSSVGTAEVSSPLITQPVPTRGQY